MPSDTLISDWLAKALARTGKPQVGLARELGLTPVQMSKTIHGRRRLTAAELPLAERYLGERAPFSSAVFGEDGLDVPQDFMAVAVYDMRRALEPGTNIRDTTPIRHIMFERSWLRRAADRPATLILFENRNEQFLTDTARHDPRFEGVYIIRAHGILFRRYVVSHPSAGTLTVRGDEEAPSLFENVEPSEIDAIGRVVWTAKFLD